MSVVAIPSKGRPKLKNWALYQQAGMDFVVFVEPAEYALYKKENVPNLVQIAQNGAGISFVRNSILDWGKKNNISKLWMIDDDVTSFGIVQNKRCHRRGAEVLLEIERKTAEMPFALVGMQYRQYAWSTGKNNPYNINSKPVEVAVLLNIPKISWQYSYELAGKEDRDFCMQAIKHSSGVLRLNKYAFNCPDVGTNNGGLQDFYQANKDAEAAYKLQNTWAQFAEMKKQNKRIDCKLHMGKFAKSLAKEVV